MTSCRPTLLEECITCVRDGKVLARLLNASLFPKDTSSIAVDVLKGTFHGTQRYSGNTGPLPPTPPPLGVTQKWAATKQKYLAPGNTVLLKGLRAQGVPVALVDPFKNSLKRCRLLTHVPLYMAKHWYTQGKQWAGQGRVPH